MDCCKHCNFRDTKYCVVEKLWQSFEDGEIDEETARDLIDSAVLNCADQYEDYQLDN